MIDSLLYAAYTSGSIFSMDPATGKVPFRDKLPVKERYLLYASPVTAEGRLYLVTRKAGTFVLAPKPKPRPKPKAKPKAR